MFKLRFLLSRVDYKNLNFRIRKIITVTLILPLFTIVTSTSAQAVSACIEGTDYSRLSSAGASTVIYKFTNTGAECTFALPNGLSSAAILAVGGGGGGGQDGGSGGGGGEIRYNASQSLSGISSINIWIGSGGAGGSWGGSSGSNGTSTTIKWSGSTQFQANPGAGASSWGSNTGGSGGSGGSGGTGTNGQQGGGGPGGVCSSSTSATNGSAAPGTAPSNSITGSSVNYGGGGGGGFGGSFNNASGYFLGAAGGGTSGGRGANYHRALDDTTYIDGASSGHPGTSNTGGGGGGGSACDARGAMYLGYEGVSQRTSGGAGAAGVVIISFSRVSQSITFGTIANRSLDSGSFSVAPTSSSGITPTLTTATSSVCTVSGLTITPVAVGTCTINANQSGDNNYAAATQVQQSFQFTSTVTFNANGGLNSPSFSSVSQTSNSAAVTLATVGTLSRTGYTFSGWNTLANGTGTTYPSGGNFTPTQNTTLYAKWQSIISYNSNGSTTTGTIQPTIAVGSAANTTLSNGLLTPGTPISNGLVLNLDASDVSTVSGSTWTNKAAGVSGADASATINGSPTYNPTDGYFMLNGSSQYMSLSTSNYNFDGTKQYSLSIAFSPTDPNKNNCLISRYNGGSVGTYRFELNSGKIGSYREVSPWGATTSGVTYSAGEIYVITTTFDGTYIRIYTNGNLTATSSAISGSVYASTIASQIGACQDSSAASRFYKGKIFNTQIYNRALSSSEVLTNYQNMLPGQKVTKTNYTLGPWNTLANNTGTSYGTVQTDLSALPTPYFRLNASSYVSTTTPLVASVGADKLSIATGGTAANLIYKAAGGNGYGANSTFATLSGPTTVGINLGNSEVPNYTLCTLARYTPTSTGATGSKGRLINGTSTNWFSGWYGGNTRQYHHLAWVLNPTDVDDNWHLSCDSGNTIYWDGVLQTTSVTPQANTSLPALSINRDPYAQYSDWEFAEMIVYDSVLSASQYAQLTRYFKNRYGLVNVSTTSASAIVSAPPTNYASTGDATLYASWQSVITYDANDATSGTPPSTQVVDNLGGTAATNSGNLTKTGFTFLGWNTAADGTGTRYPVGSTITNSGNLLLYAQWALPVQLPVASINPSSLLPYQRFVASDYDATTKTWKDSSGNGRNASRVVGTPTVVTTTGNGASKSFSALEGSNAVKVFFGNDPIPSTWTVFALTRYNGANKGRLLAGDGDRSTPNWLMGQYAGWNGVAHFNGWVSPQSTAPGIAQTDWAFSVGTPNNYRINGAARGNSGGTTYLPPLGLNVYSTDNSDFQVAEIIIFDRTLSSSEIGKVEDYFDEKYGLTFEKVGTYKTANTMSIAATVGGRSDTFTTTDGYGNKTFSISPTVSGITLDTSTVNSVAVVVGSLVPAGTYIETITATDQAGLTAIHVVTITVADPIKWAVGSPTSLVTTVGKSLSQRLSISGGLSGKIVTLTKQSSIPLPGISVDTSTLASSSYVTLNLSPEVLPGTYSISLLVTDDTKRTSTLNISLTINNLPALTYLPGTADTSTIIKDGLWFHLDFPSSYSGTGTNAVDLSGNNGGSGINSGTVYSSSLGGGSVSLGNSNRIWANIGTISSSSALSKFYWIYPTADTGIIVDVCDAGCNYHESEFELSAGKLYARVWNLTPISTTETITINAWHYIGYIYDPNGSTYIYVDGKLAASGANSGTRGPPANPQYDGLPYADTTKMQTAVALPYSLGAAHYYKRVLSPAEIFSNFSNTAPRFLGTTFPGRPISGSATITTTQGVSSSYPVFSASSGTGNKILGITPVTAGITIDTSTVNSAILSISSSVQATSSTVARVYTETITATDSMSAITNYKLTINVNPPVIITPTTAATVSTTYGVAAYDTFTATYGTGPYTFGNTASSYQSAFTITNTSNSVGVLKIASNLPAGTYYDTITVTDSVSATTSYVLTVIVNPGMTLTGAGSNTVTTTITKSTSLRVNIANGTGTKTMTISSPVTGITLDSSTISSGYVLLNVSSLVPANTFSVPLTIRDSAGSTTTETFTVIVNKWPVIGTPTSVASGLKLHLDAGNNSSYSGSGTTWTDLSGNGKNGTWQSAPIFSSDNGGVLKTGNVTTQYLSTAGLTAMRVFTAEAWVNFNSIPANDNCVLSDKYNTVYINLSICFNNAGKIVGGYWNSSNGWVQTSATGTLSLNTWYHFAYTVSVSGSTYTSTLYQNGIVVGTPNTSIVSPYSGSTGFLVGTNWRADTKVIDGEIGVVRIYDRALSSAEIQQNFNAQGNRFMAANSGGVSLVTTQGITSVFAIRNTTQGTGDKTFTLTGTPTTSGFSLDTSTANAFILNIASSVPSTDSVTAKTYYETVTATDVSTASTTLVHTITINPAVQETYTAASLTTTSGIAAYDTFTASYGTGNKTFALSGSPNTTGFTLTYANNVAVLKVEPTANPGTYYETVTATDEVGATNSLMVTITVLPGPTVSGIAVLSAVTGISYRSPAYTAINGFGTKTFTLSSSPTNANIRIDTATAGYAFITVGNTGVTQGTYYETITVTDAKGAVGRYLVTLTVKDPVTLNGNQDIDTVYGTSVSTGYTTSGTGIFNIYASDVCTSTKSTFVGNGTNGVNGVTYTVEQFLGASSSSCGWVVPAGVDSITALLVAGGGQGGEGRGGGGGAGGVLYGQLAVTAGSVLPLQVGLGGSISTCNDAYRPAGCDGLDSSIGTTVIAKGGGGGGGHSAVTAGRSGGSGGGGGMNYLTESPTAGSALAQTYPAGWITAGNAGGSTRNGHPTDTYRNTGGGGGATSAGFVGNCWTASSINGRGCLNSGGGTAAYSSNAGDRPDGGEGLDSVTAASGAWAPAVTLTGTAKSYAGGGGGAVGIATSEANGSYYSGPPGVGKAGAGNGANITTIFGGNATPNSGSGGGGGVNADGGNRTGGNGGSGVIVIRYVTPSAASFNDSITITTDNTGTLSANGQVTVNTPSALKVGTYTKTISIAGYDSANKLGTANTYTITVRVAKATPTVTMSLPGNVTTGKYGSPIAVAAAVSTPGKVEFKDGAFTIGGCESVTALSGVATCNWIPKSIGTRTLYATLTPDDTDDYNNSARTAFGVTVGKADTLTVTAGDETFDFIPNTAAPVTKKATFTGLVASDSITAVSMLYSGTANDGTVISSTTPPTLAGTYTITPNYPTDLTALTYTNYDTSVYGRICTLVPPGIISCTGGDPAISNYYTSIVVVPGTLTINRIAPTTSLVYANSNNVTYSPTATLAATTKSRSGDGVQTYSVTTASTCSVDSSTALVSVIQAGSCTVNMSVSQSANYLAKLDSATITISKASRTISLTSSTASLKYTDTATVTTTVSGGASDGAITYGLNSTPACSFDSLGGVLTATAGTGTCTLTANIAEGVNYLANTVAGTLNQTVAPADAPIITIDSVTAVDYAAGARVQVTPTYRITGFKGTDAASSLTLTYNFVSNPFETFGYSDTRTPFDAGTYSIVPSAMVMSSGLASNYQTPNYAAAATPLVINRIAQAPISIENLNGEIAVPLKLTITGGNNPLGTVTFTKISGAACTLTGNSLNATASGSAAIICQIRATLAANRNYLSASSDTYTVVVRKFEVIPVFTFGNGTTGISLSSNTTLTKDEDSCTTGCVPTITGVSVYEASEGDPIVLTGKFFTGATRVIFNVFTEASVFNVDSDTQITVQVPVGLAIGDGRIEVVTPRGITPAWWDFAVIVG